MLQEMPTDNWSSVLVGEKRIAEVVNSLCNQCRMLSGLRRSLPMACSRKRSAERYEIIGVLHYDALSSQGNAVNDCALLR